MKELFERSLKKLKGTVELIEDDALRACCEAVLSDERFLKCTAAKSRHQAYEGGLVVHTCEVLDIAVFMTTPTCLDKVTSVDVITAAAIFHDYGKIYDYVKLETPVVDAKGNTISFDYTSHADKITHLARSYAEFMKLADKYKLDEKLRDEISHCILAHHGRKEWGSPVEPKSPEAYALHFADMMSCHCTAKSY